MVELSPDVGVCCSQSPQILRFLFYIMIYYTENIPLGKGSLETHEILKVHWKELLTGFRMREIKYNKVHSMVLSSHRERKCIWGKMLWINFCLSSITELMDLWEKKPVKTAEHKNRERESYRWKLLKSVRVLWRSTSMSLFYTPSHSFAEVFFGSSMLLDCILQGYRHFLF